MLKTVGLCIAVMAAAIVLTGCMHPAAMAEFTSAKNGQHISIRKGAVNIVYQNSESNWSAGQLVTAVTVDAEVYQVKEDYKTVMQRLR